MGVSIANYAIAQGPAVLTLLMPMSHLEAEWQFDHLRMTVDLVQKPAAASGEDMFNERLLKLAELEKIDWELGTET